MPNVFGLETPQEVQQRMLDESRERFLEGQKSESSGARVGASLGAIFGGTIRKSLDTRKARKSEAQRLVESTGMSVSEAREQAKENVPRDFAEVRKAKRVEKAMASAQETLDTLTPVLGVTLATAAAHFTAARQLRELGMRSEAQAMSMKGVELRQEEEIRLIALEDAKVTLAQKRATLNETGDISFTDLLDNREEAVALIDAEEDPDKLEALELRKGDIEAQIAKLNFISMSDADERALSKSGRSKVAGELVELQSVDNKLAAIEGDLVRLKGDVSQTKWGELAAETAGFMEKWFNIAPETIGADTLIEDVTAIQGGGAFVSAQIRHALTGAAMSAAEAVYLEPFLLNPADNLSTKLAKVRVVRRYMQLDIDTRNALINNKAAGDRWLSDNERLAKQDIKDEKKSRKAATPRDDTVASGLSTVQGLIKAAEGE